MFTESNFLLSTSKGVRESMKLKSHKFGNTMGFSKCAISMYFPTVAFEEAFESACVCVTSLNILLFNQNVSIRSN